MAKYKETNKNKIEIVALLKEEPAIAYWELAEVLDLHENTVSKMMRCPSDEQAAKIKAAIAEIRAAQQ